MRALRYLISALEVTVAKEQVDVRASETALLAGFRCRRAASVGSRRSFPI